MKYIVCGLEHVGLRVTEALLELNEEVTLITLNKNEPNLFFVRNKVSRYIEGDARNGETLKLADIEHADYLLIFTSNEVKNIEINCKAKELNPNIPTALLIKNSNYAKIAEQVFDCDLVVHLPSIVCSPIVSACINKKTIHSISEDGKDYYFGYISSRENTFLNGKKIFEIEDIYNVKIIRLFNESTEGELLKSDHMINGGSLLYLTTNKTHFNQEDLFKDRHPVSVIISETSKRLDLFKEFSISPGIRKVIALYSLLILLSVFIFKEFLGLSFINSLYFVITTTTTVGYGDINFQNSPFWIKLYGCFLMLAGAALLASLFSVITDHIISRRLGRYVSLYTRNIKDHVIVAGIGSIGFGVVTCLNKMGIKTVVIEKDPDNANVYSLQHKVPVLIGDASNTKILMKAGIKRAKTLAALIDDDLNNINIILKGCSFNNELHTVARIFSNELNKKASAKFEIDNVLSASMIAVPYIISSLIHKDIIWAGKMYDKIYCLFKTEAKDFMINRSVDSLIETYVLYPALIVRNGNVMFANNESSIMDKDLVYSFMDYQSLKRIKDKFSTDCF